MVHAKPQLVHNRCERMYLVLKRTSSISVFFGPIRSGRVSKNTLCTHIDWESWILLFGADLKKPAHVTLVKRSCDSTSGCESWLDLDCMECAFATFWSLLLCYDETKLNSNMGYDHATVNAGNIYIQNGCVNELLSCLFCYHAKAIREETLWLRLVTPAVCHFLSTLRPPNLLV